MLCRTFSRCNGSPAFCGISSNRRFALAGGTSGKLTVWTIRPSYGVIPPVAVAGWGDWNGGEFGAVDGAPGGACTTGACASAREQRAAAKSNAVRVVRIAPFKCKPDPGEV